MTMKQWERKIAPAGFFLAGVLFTVAAVAPTFREQPLNATFLPLGIVFAILGGVAWRKAQGVASPPK
jgi:drug/metabolite transporter (DMT)-like permease